MGELHGLIYAIVHHPSSCVCHHYLQAKYKKYLLIKSQENVVMPFSQLQPYGSYLLPCKPEFRSDLTLNLKQPFPHPNDASDKIWLRSAHLSQRYLYLSRVMRKPTFCICKNKDADQLRGNREADQRLCFRYIDSTIPLLSKSEISSR